MAMYAQEQVLHEKAAKEFVEKVLASIGKDVDAIILYGSVARGESTENSDIDIMVISRNIHQYKKMLGAIRSDLDAEYGTMTTLVYRTFDQILDAVERGSPFLREVFREGKVLYDSGTYRQFSKGLLNSEPLVFWKTHVYSSKRRGSYQL